ncbi:PREDICTED: protein SPACA7 [Dipodomys ordii]|uniref:Protein SPACA7 n=1 Tax=Dipodomys ordii TaxID=10020 RepID=A0A1S3FNN5_DIPOR|nr:PREDICTED: protein SPACA7 [Dipodomys ordii]
MSAATSRSCHLFLGTERASGHIYFLGRLHRNLNSIKTAPQRMFWDLQRRKGVQDEILIQELLDPSKSAFETESTASTLSTKQYSGIDDNYQGDGAENYHELLESSELSSGNEERNYNTGKYDPPIPLLDSEEKKDPKNDRYGRLSILDKILQNIGRSSGNPGLTGSGSSWEA